MRAMMDEECARMLLAVIVANGGKLEVPNWALAESQKIAYITTQVSPSKDCFILGVRYYEGGEHIPTPE
jgi:hypothetical protein